MTESGSRDELPVVTSKAAPENPANQAIVTKVEIDPSLPLKLLFLINASSHEKLIGERSSKDSFSSGNIRTVGAKLRTL